MATLAIETTRRHPFAADMYERVLAMGAIMLLGCVVVALGRGYASWARIPMPVWAHLSTIFVALALTPVMLLRPRGDRLHRKLGWVWLSAMMLTAAISLFIDNPHMSRFSYIHILSVFVLIQAPMIANAARKHNIKGHRRSVRAMVTGALLIAGFFTFPFNRLLGHWLFG
jgi:uncharacterized membrane protein